MIALSVNGRPFTVEAESDTPLLWVLRDVLGMTGTKFGCGKTLCRACTVYLNGTPMFSCRLPLSAAAGQSVVTIATAVTFTFKEGRITIEYKQDGATRTLDITEKLVEKNFTLSGGVQIKNDPQGRSLKGFVGVSF